MPQNVSCGHCRLTIDGLCVELGGAEILSNVSLSLNCGEILCVAGPNGAGKSTLLKAILKEVPVKSGSVSFMFGDRRPGRSLIGYVPQRINFDPDSPVSVADLFAAGLSRRPVWTGVGVSMRKTIAESLDKVSGRHLLDRRICELSGGELQRTLLAAAMTPPPGLLLLDEPNAAVDAAGLELFYSTVRDLKLTHHVSIIMITHDISEAPRFADRMALLKRTVVCEGKPADVIADPRFYEAFGFSPAGEGKAP